MSQPPVVAERTILLGYLNAQRKDVLGILDGISEEDLRRPLLPSGWTCVGLIQHLALDVERFWFRAVMASEHSVIDHLADEGDAWQVASDVRAEDIFDLYRQEIVLADAIIAAIPLDSPPA